jgi:hypothetical protein
VDSRQQQWMPSPRRLRSGKIIAPLDVSTPKAKTPKAKAAPKAKTPKAKAAPQKTQTPKAAPKAKTPKAKAAPKAKTPKAKADPKAKTPKAAAPKPKPQSDTADAIAEVAQALLNRNLTQLPTSTDQDKDLKRIAAEKIQEYSVKIGQTLAADISAIDIQQLTSQKAHDEAARKTAMEALEKARIKLSKDKRQLAAKCHFIDIYAPPGTLATRYREGQMWAHEVISIAKTASNYACFDVHELYQALHVTLTGKAVAGAVHNNKLGSLAKQYLKTGNIAIGGVSFTQDHVQEVTDRRENCVQLEFALMTMPPGAVDALTRGDTFLTQSSSSFWDKTRWEKVRLVFGWVFQMHIVLSMLRIVMCAGIMASIFISGVRTSDIETQEIVTLLAFGGLAQMVRERWREIWNAKPLKVKGAGVLASSWNSMRGWMSQVGSAVGSHVESLIVPESWRGVVSLLKEVTGAIMITSGYGFVLYVAVRLAGGWLVDNSSFSPETKQAIKKFADLSFMFFNFGKGLVALGSMVMEMGVTTMLKTGGVMQVAGMHQSLTKFARIVLTFLPITNTTKENWVVVIVGVWDSCVAGVQVPILFADIFADLKALSMGGRGGRIHSCIKLFDMKQTSSGEAVNVTAVVTGTTTTIAKAETVAQQTVLTEIIAPLDKCAGVDITKWDTTLSKVASHQWIICYNKARKAKKRS